MKVLLVSPLPPPTGGIATWTVGYKRYCERNGVQLTIVNNALIGSRGKQITGKRNCFDEVNRTFRVIYDLIRKMLKQKPDVIHLNSSCSRFGIFRDCICALIGEIASVPVVVQCHCNIQDQVHGKLAVRAFRFLVSKSKRVLVLNRFSEEYAKRYAAGRVEVVPNFVDGHDMFAREMVSEKVRHAVFVGHVRREKGAIEILKAAEQLPDVKFTLIGPVQQEIADMICGSNVELAGTQTHERVQQILRKADVFLFPSYTEGFANALLEAMAAGLPVIATDVGANAELIEKEGGIIIPAGEADAIVKAIDLLKEDRELRLKMSIWNVGKVRSVYLLDAVMEKLIKIYEEAIV